MDLVIIGTGVADWVESIEHHGIKRFRTTYTRDKSGLRVGLKPDTLVQLLGEWMRTWLHAWGTRMGADVQLTFAMDPDPELPPWETMVPEGPRNHCYVPVDGTARPIEFL